MSSDIKKLQEENVALKKELLESRSLYNQLTQERSHETFDERRIYLLKSQVIQLERQLLLIYESISSRSAMLLEIENVLSWIGDLCRSLISIDVKGPDVPVQRSRLVEMVEKTESARIKLYKNIENVTKEKLAKPMLFFNDFVKPAHQGELTLFDICSGNLDHVNLKQVGRLESSLSQLYKDIIALHQSITTGTASKESVMASCVQTDRLTTQLLATAARLDICSHDLLSLSMLFPNAPWPALKRPICAEVSTEKVISSLPTLPRSKSMEVHKVLEALIKTTNHKVYMKEQELKAVKDELNFHQTFYDLQKKYTNELFEVVRLGYGQFEASVQDTVCKPLQEVLHSYNLLTTTTSEDGLRTFLKCFKDRSEMLAGIVSSLSVHPDEQPSEGEEGLSEFGKQFLSSVHEQCEECHRRREKAANENQELKTQQETLEHSLQKLLEKMRTEKASGDIKDSAKPPSELIRNRTEGPSVEYYLKSAPVESKTSNNHQSDISGSLDRLDLTDSDIDSQGIDNSPPKSRLKMTSQNIRKNSTSYSKNRSLELRRSGSLSRINQHKANIPTNIETPDSDSAQKSDEGSKKDKNDIKPSVNTSAKGRRKIPTLKAPFR